MTCSSLFPIQSWEPKAVRAALLLVALSVLVSCASSPVDEQLDVQGEPRANVTVLKPARVESMRPQRPESLTLPDLLYAGLQALDADRLLTPEGDNAFDYFTRARALDSDNDIAREGLAAIVERYLALAREAIGNGSFDAAQVMLDRAQLVDSTAPDIARARGELASERESGDLFFTLDGSEVSAQSDAARAVLADIARQARDCEAFFLITAPTDAVARWMFSAMRESVEGYRLRGNIELSSQTGVRLRLPESVLGCGGE